MLAKTTIVAGYFERQSNDQASDERKSRIYMSHCGLRCVQVPFHPQPFARRCRFTAESNSRFPGCLFTNYVSASLCKYRSIASQVFQGIGPWNGKVNQSPKATLVGSAKSLALG